MKVLFVTHYADLYGANMSMCNLAAEYKKRGIDAEILCPEKGNLMKKLEKAGIKYYVVPFKNCVVGMRKRFLWDLAKIPAKETVNRKYLSDIERSVKIYDYDLIHTNSMCVSFGAMLAEKYGKPHVWHIREYMEEDYNIKAIRTRSLKRAYEYTDKFIAISNSVRDKFSAVLGENKIETIYNGVCCEPMPRIENDKFVFTIVGIISPNKGTLEAVEAFGRISKSCPNAELWVIGGGDFTRGYGKRLIESAKRYSVEEKIKFLGQRMDVTKLLSHAKCGLMCSKKEAFGRVTIEYMQNRLVVIGSRSGGTPELIENGKTGFLYEPGNTAELAEKMEYVYDNCNDMQPIIDTAYKRAIDNFSIERCAGEIIETYTNLIQNRRYKL